MKILHLVTLVSPDGAFGGPLRVALNQAAELRTRGHEVTLAAGWRGPGRPPDQLEGVPARLFPAVGLLPRLGFSGLFSPALVRWLLAEVGGYDLVHVHAGRDLITLSAMAVARLRRATYVTQTHGMIGIDHRPVARVLDRVLTRRLLDAAGTRFVLTGQEQHELADVLGHDRAERLPNGVPAPTQLAIGDDGGNGADGGDVLFCARLHPRKRPLAFVEVADDLRSRGLSARFSLVGPDEGELAAVRRSIEERGLAERVVYEGALDYGAVLDRMRRATVYVLPSVDEPFPMTLLEALSLGLPCVCTDSSGVARTLQEYGAALVTDGSVPAMADAVASLLADPARRRELARRARRVIGEQYSIRAVVDRLEAAYRRVVAGGPAAVITGTAGPQSGDAGTRAGAGAPAAGRPPARPGA